MKKLKIGILTIICALAMVMPVMAAPTVSQYFGQMGTAITGTLTRTYDYQGGRPVVKHIEIKTKTSETCNVVRTKHLIADKVTGERVFVNNSYSEGSATDDKEYGVVWTSANSRECDTTYKVYGTHEAYRNGVWKAVYTSDVL